MVMWRALMLSVTSSLCVCFRYTIFDIQVSRSVVSVVTTLGVRRVTLIVGRLVVATGAWLLFDRRCGYRKVSLGGGR